MECKFFHFICIILACVCLLSSTAMGGKHETLGFQQNDIHLDDFRSAGVIVKDEEGAKEYQWVMRGTSADIHDDVYDIYSLDMTVNPKSKTQEKPADKDGKKPFLRGAIQMLSPACKFNQNTAELRSSEHVLILAEGFTAEGVGYDVYLSKDAMIVAIRNSVKIVLKNVPAKSLDKLP